MYFESHINIPLQEGYKFEQWKIIAKELRFKLSNMTGNDLEQESKKKETILTTHTQDYDEMVLRVKKMIEVIRLNGESVLRYKIEEALMDSRISDVFSVIEDNDYP